MNTYYLKKFRRKAWKMVMIQYYYGVDEYAIVWRKSKKLALPIRIQRDLEKAKKDLQEVRRDIILKLLENTTKIYYNCRPFNNRY